MVFSSPEFLFLFLPLVLLFYYVVNAPLKNGFLLVASLFFYTWGEGHLVALMIGSIGVNYLAGIGLAAVCWPCPFCLTWDCWDTSSIEISFWKISWRRAGLVRSNIKK